MTTATPQRNRRGGPFSRRRSTGSDNADDGPRAKFRQLLPYLLQNKPLIAIVVVLSIIGSLATVAQPLLVRQGITNFQDNKPYTTIAVIVLVLLVSTALVTAFQQYLLQRMGTNIVYSVRRVLVRRMLGLPISEFDTRRTGDLVSRVGSDTTLLYSVMTQGLVSSIGGALQFVGSLIAMAFIDPLLLGITVVVIGLSIVGVGSLSGRIRSASQGQQTKVGELGASVARAVGAIRTIRASNATEREIDAVEDDALGARTMGFKVARASALVVPIAGIALQVSVLAVLGVGGLQVAGGSLSIATLIAFVILLFTMIAPLGSAFGAVTSVSQALGALGRIQEIVDLPSESELDAGVTPASAVELDDSISFHDVVFRYPEKAHKSEAAKLLDEAGLSLPEDADESVAEPIDARDRTVLHGVSFSAPKGKRTALVGPSGAGKSTILALIERFYDPTSGIVRLGGVDIRGLERVELRSQIGYVEQDAPVLAGTIRENLVLGAPDATDEQCVDVLHAVNLTEVLERNALGLDAPVGEDGVMLSGGERQRLAIARTLLVAPPILLLDESTSSLDGLNEQLLREAIDAVAEHRTLIVIAHRLSTVVDSDQIVVLDHGRVVGVGTHSELVKSTPLYKDLAKHQLLV
ncbi:MAG TPA: ABC transporter ATP-binding protein [Galbitalea sp.]|jgi:ATP-binding cassette subfamily B protein|nr:ABC transporter ATP-binding protein [Galbitalea sp.]